MLTCCMQLARAITSLVWTFCTSSMPTREPGDALRRCMFAKIPLAIPTRESNPNGLINRSIKRLFSTAGAVSNTFPINCESMRLFVTGGADWYASATSCSIGISGPCSVGWADVWTSIFSFTFIESSPNFLLFPNTLELHSSRTEGFIVMFISISFIRLTLGPSGIEKTLQSQAGTTQLKGSRLREIGGIRKT